MEEKPELKLIPEDAPVTVSVVEPETVPEVAEMVVLCPTVPAVASPAAVIVAPAAFEEAQVTTVVRSWVLLSEYVPAAWNWTVVPAAAEELAGVTAMDFNVADWTTLAT